MKYQKLGKTDITVSKVAFGCWGIGGGNVWSDMSVDAAHVADLLDAASDLGINYVDTAPVYGIGHSEEILGKALQGRRDRFIVQTKCSLNWRGEGGEFEYERDGKTVMRDHRASAVRKDVEDSLTRMNLDHIDSLVVHRISRTVPVEETMAELQKMIREGKIRAVLISNSKPEDFENYSRYGTVAGVQEKLSLFNNAQEVYFPTCDKYEAVFQVYGSLEEGALTGRRFYEKSFGKGDVRANAKWMQEPYRAKTEELFDCLDALAGKYDCSSVNLVQAWTLKQYERLNLLTGFRRAETMQDTCKALDVEISDEDCALIGKLGKAVREAE